MNLITIFFLGLILGQGAQEEPPAEKLEVLRLDVEAPAKVSQEALAELGLPVTLKLVNQSKDDIRVTPWIAVEVFDEKDQPLKASRKLGRWGRSRGCTLEKLKFETIAAGKSLERSADVARYQIDPQYILEWKLEPGSYRIVFNYEADPVAVRKLCKCQKVDHDAADQAWNQVTKLKASTEFKVVIH